MGDNFGLKIGVEGEREFKKALSDINQSFKVLGSEMQLVTSQFEKNDKSAQALTSRNEVLNREIDAQKEKISTLKAALDNAASSFGENDRRTQNWQVQLNKARAALNGMERELSGNEKALTEMGNELQDGTKSANKFGDEVQDTGKQANDAAGKFEKLGGILKGVGAAMGTAFVVVGAAAVGAAKSLTDMTVGASKYADNILTMSSVTGMSTDRLQAYSYAAELVDTSLETLTGSMARNVRSMSSAQSGTGKMAEAYKVLGISVTDANGNLRDAETVYWEAIDALGNVSNETERDALAMQLFGKSAQELNPLIAQGSAGIAQLTDEAKRMGAVLSTESLEALGKFDDSMQRLKSGGEAAKNTLGMVLLPQLQVLADGGVSLLGTFTSSLNEANGDWTKISVVIGDTVGGLVSMIMEQLPQIIQLGLSIVSSVGGAILSNLPMLVDAASQIIMTLLEGLISALPGITEGALRLVLALVNGIVENLPALVEAAVQMIATLVGGIGAALPQLIPAIVQAVVLICRTLIENLPLVLDAALQIILGLTSGLLAALPQLIAALPSVITALVDFLVSAIPQIIDAGIKLLVSLVTALPTIIQSVVQAIPKIIDSVISAVIEAIPLIIDAGIKLLVALIANLPTIITEVVKAVPQIIAALVSGFSGSVEQMAQVGGNLIKGLWQGISDAGAWLWSKISGFFGGVVDRIKDFFGIHSPSTLFAGLGTNLAEGLGVGFSNEMNRVASDMQNAVPTDFSLNTRAYTADASGRDSVGGSNITQNILVVTPKALSEKELAREFKNLSRKLALEF